MANRAVVRKKRLAKQLAENELANQHVKYVTDRLPDQYSQLLFGDPKKLTGFIIREARKNKVKLAILGGGSGFVASILRDVNRLKPPGDLEVLDVEPYPRLFGNRGNLVKNRMEDMHDVPTGSQNLIFSVYAHNYTQDKLAALSEAHRILSPEGTGFILFNPHAPIKFSAGIAGKGKEELTITLNDLLKYLKSRGHNITVTPSSYSNNVSTLQIQKNKRQLGINAKLISTPAWESLGAKRGAKWYDSNSSAELGAHYATNKKMLNRLKKFIRE